jgi:hypothetical protein
MIKTGLEFANGTTDDCKRLVVGLFQPAELLGWYREARRLNKTADVVLVSDAADPSGVKAWPRGKYVEQLRVSMGANAAKMLPSLTIAHQSAHQVAMLPYDSDAFWLVVVRGQQLPLMVVLYANPYEELGAGDPAPVIGSA